VVLLATTIAFHIAPGSHDALPSLSIFAIVVFPLSLNEYEVQPHESVDLRNWSIDPSFFLMVHAEFSEPVYTKVSMVSPSSVVVTILFGMARRFLSSSSRGS
jgi:hypothetical protein